MAEHGLTKQSLIANLSRSPHGALKEYVPLGKAGFMQEAEFMSHLTAWDRTHGQIRDSKVALPIIGLSTLTDEELAKLLVTADRAQHQRGTQGAWARNFLRLHRRMIGALARQREQLEGTAPIDGALDG